MDAFRFVILMLTTAAGFMAARWLVPHFIDGMAYYVAVALAGIAMCGAVLGVIRG